MEYRTTEVISLFETYHAKNILLTGATGFLGKVLLVMILDRLPMAGCIYVLIRNKKESSAKNRFINEILNSPVFHHLRKKYPNNFEDYLFSKVKIIEGDVVLPHLGIEDEVATKLYTDLDLVINVAGLVDFFPDIRKGLDININGTLNVADFANRCHSASLMHVSTCYVAGKRSGVFEEKVEIDKSPNGLMFDAEKEYADLCQNLLNLKDHVSRKKFIELGKERADYWGWNNTYVYTKAIAEMLVVQRYPKLQKAIVRPAIVESSLHFPFPGWNEGLNTSAPICKSLSGWYPCFVGKKEIPLDLIPVDEVCNAMLTIGAACLQNKASPVYQLATSGCNPCSMSLSVKMIRNWHRKNYRIVGKSWAEKYLRALVPIKCISIDHKCSPQHVNRFIVKTMNKLDNYSHFNWVKKLRKKLVVMKQELAKLHILYESYVPFCYEYHYVFISNEINKIIPKETMFSYQPTSINWKDYWTDIHIPGIVKWVFSGEYIKDYQNNKLADFNFSRKGFYYFCKMFFKWYCPLKVKGQENLPATPYILFSNHCSHLDTPVLMLATGKTFGHFSMIAAKDYFFDNHRRYSIVNKLMNIISIDRNPTKRSLKNDIEACKHAVQDKQQNLIIYPEGTRSITGDVQSFKSGVAMMAVELGIPLVPVYINGTFDTLGKGNNFPKPGKISVMIGKSIMPNPASIMDRRSLFDYYRSLIKSLESSINDLKERSAALDV